MPLITYENPTILNSINKPIPIANKSLPYNDLSDSRRFEELLYSIYKTEIENNQFEQFDGISLMNGVRDKGRDCALLKQGKNYGLIQCKRYDKNYGKDDFGEEIVKFTLYSLLEPTLMYDINEFIYYIAVSTGFVLACSDFIDDFNNSILEEPNLDKWINKNISNPTLNSFKLKNPKDELLSILSKIKVKKIIPADLDLLLSKETNQKTLPLFFQVRSVTDNSIIERVEKKLDFYNSHAIDETQLNLELSRGSIYVKSQKNEFEGIPHSHIPRLETDALFNWIVAPAVKDKDGKDQNICLLAGNAGMGKTVIIKDLYQKLLEEKIPTLALKADKLYSSSIKQLGEKINLSIPVFDFIEQCKQRFPKLIILIDQIDALSQSISSDRSFLDTYLKLIETYKYDSSVRIIISVRIFDLYYDPSLRVYKNIKSIEVKKLHKDAVLSQLKKIGLEKVNISNGLLELLQIPNNLDVLSRIFTKIDFAGVTSIQSLYSELWKSKIIHIEPSFRIKKNKVVKLLYKISKRMFELQRITVNEQIFEKHTKELSYLKSEQLIKDDNNEIQFFHQSFYDYVFAKRFVESKDSIDEYLKTQGQSIMVRPALKMIINYLREFDHKQYLKEVKLILTNKKIYFHIKHLIVSILSTAEDPSHEEKLLFLKWVKPSKKYSKVFLDHVTGPKWLEYLLFNREENMVFQTVNNIEKIIPQLLLRNLDGNEDIVLSYLLEIEAGKIVFSILYNLKKWDNSKAFQLFEKYFDIIKKENWGFIHLLENIAEVNPKYVLNKIKDELVFDERNRSADIEHSQKELLKKLFNKIPQEIIEYLMKVLEKSILEKMVDDKTTDILSDFVVSDADLKEEEYLNGKEYSYKLLAIGLRKQASAETEYFKHFLNKYINSKYKSILKLVVFSLQTNEEKYPVEIFSLLIHISQSRFFAKSGKLNFEIRNLLRISFPYLNEIQQLKIISIIKTLNFKSEIHIWEREGKKIMSSQWGLKKYHFYKCLPVEVIAQDFQISIEFKELQRKFGDLQDGSGSRSWGGAVQAPLSISAYQNMKKKDWLNSFRKYNSEDRSGNHTSMEDFLKGGLIEHSRAFSEAVTKNPSKHLEIINDVIEDSEIPVMYAIMGVEGLTKAGFSPEIILSFLKRIIQNELDLPNTMQSIWIAKYLIGKNEYDKDIVDFLINQALTNQNPEKEIDDDNHQKVTIVRGLVSSGINSVRGAAAYALVLVNDKKFEEEVFGTLQTVLRNDLNQVKAAAMFQFAFLMNVDKQRTFDLFMSIVSIDKNVKILPAAIWSVQYFIHFNFKQLIPFFKRIIDIENIGDEDMNSLSSVLFAAWLNEYPDSETLFKNFLDKHPEASWRAINDSFQNFYFKGEVSYKSLALLEMLIEKNDKKVVQKFEIEFLHLNKIKFVDIFDFLLKYVQSNSFKMSDYFLDYLTYNCSQNVCECIDLFELGIKNKSNLSEEDLHYLRYEENATKFIVGAFNLLRPKQVKKHSKYQIRLLKAFDKILKDDRFKNNAENVLERIIA